MTSPSSTSSAPLPSKALQIEVPLSKILETAQLGFRRAAVFMGLGCNAANRTDFVDYQLDHASGLRLLPEKVDDKVLAEWKSEFYQWTVSNGLRELLDFTNVYFDQIYEAAFIYHERRRDAKSFEKFQRLGLRDKVVQLSSKYDLGCRYPETLESVGAVRNCLVHRLGIVGEADVDANGQLILKWFGVNFIFDDKQGRRHALPDITAPGADAWTSPSEGILSAQFGIKEAKFPLNTKVVLTPHVLHQVIFSMGEMAADYVRRLTERSVKEGLHREIKAAKDIRSCCD